MGLSETVRQEHQWRPNHPCIFAGMWSNRCVSVDLDHSSRPQDVQATFCATLVDEWIRCGVSTAVVSPGSRSTPLALALAEREEISVEVHIDERSAAFMALGIGLASGHPAVVLTTSGTAGVHLHAAVVEADLAAVPLIAVTADRPWELHDVGAPQTVAQSGLYGNAPRWFSEPGVADLGASHGWRSLAARCVAESTTGPKGPGPVHLNLAFREPLIGGVGTLPLPRPDATRWHTTVGSRFDLDDVGLARLISLTDSHQGVIIAGERCGDPEAVLALAEVLGWPVLGDSRSGCRGRSGVISQFDAIVRTDAAVNWLRPEVALRLGALPASKALGKWLVDCQATEIHVDGFSRWIDPSRRSSHVLRADPTLVCEALAKALRDKRKPVELWAAHWEMAQQCAAAAIGEVLDNEKAFSEPDIARTVASTMRPEASLVVSSSMPVRDLEWFGADANGARVLSNRGANGIDGVISTAIGVAVASRMTGASTTVLIGDVAFLHDSTALVGLAGRNLDLTIVVVNNDGGGIFSFLPQAQALESQRFEQLFGTPHRVELARLVTAHGIEVLEPSTPAELTSVLSSTHRGAARVVIVRTDRSSNVEIHNRIHEAVETQMSELWADNR